MKLLWILAAAIHFGALLCLWLNGKKVLSENEKQNNTDLQSQPMVGMIIPASGTHPSMEPALRSLLCQDYRNCVPVIVTATEEDPASFLVKKLQNEFPTLKHVISGLSDRCGQKNHNTLAAIQSLKKDVNVYVFCDSTHIANRDFVTHLVRPIINGESNFSSGYHMVTAEDDMICTRAYQVSVLFMRLLQSFPSLTQPWGGAMAIKREAFERLNIEKLWKENVVDDCSLASYLQQHKEKVVFSPNALLATTSRQHSRDVWRAWMERQILFLKFCVPVQWLGLGCFAAIMLLTPLQALFFLTGMAGKVMGGLAFVYLAALAAVLAKWRDFLPEGSPLLQWISAFATATGMFFLTFCDTVFARGILWHGIYYTVGRGGKVIARKQTAS